MKTAALFGLLMVLAIPAGAQTAATNGGSASSTSQTDNDSRRYVGRPTEPPRRAYSGGDGGAEAEADSGWGWDGGFLGAGQSGGMSAIPATPDSVTFGQGDEGYEPSAVMGWRAAIKLGRQQQAATDPAARQAAPEKGNSQPTTPGSSHQTTTQVKPSQQSQSASGTGAKP